MERPCQLAQTTYSEYEAIGHVERILISCHGLGRDLIKDVEKVYKLYRNSTGISVPSRID
jgi:hypothetical protein